MNMKKITCLIVLCFVAALKLHAQRPSAILVMLNAEKNKINYYNGLGQTEMANEVRSEVETVMNVTISDFTDHFSYSPIYYFMDTNLALVKEKKFDGILFDNKRRIFESSPVKPCDSSILIAYYGMPPVEFVDEGHLSRDKNTYINPGYLGKGLVILGHNFKKLPKSDRLHYTYRYESWVPKGIKTNYSYTSPKSNITYVSIAEKLQKLLSESRVRVIKSK
jgi:hypothetical protein